MTLKLGDEISSSRILRYYRIPIFIVFVGTLLSIAFCVAVIMYNVSSMQDNFTYMANMRVQSLQKELDSMSASLELGGNAMRSQQKLEEDEFRSIAGSMLQQSGMEAVMLLESRKTGPAIVFREGAITPAAIAQILPRLPSGAAEGMSGVETVPLHRNSPSESGVQMAVTLPLQKHNAPAWFVTGVMNTSSLFARTINWGEATAEERIYLYDQNGKALFVRDNGVVQQVSDAYALSYEKLLRESGFYIEKPVYLGTLRWKVVMIPAMLYMTGIWHGMPLVVLFGGLIIVGLLGYERFQAATYGMRTAMEVERKTFALSASEARLRNIFEHAVDGLIAIDSRGIIESFNPACERMFGYSAQEVVGRNVSMLMPEPYHSEHDRYIRNYQTTGVPRIIGTGRDVEARRKDGSVFPMELGISEVRIAGRVFYSGILRDITARRQAEKSTGLLASIVEFSDDAIISKTLDGAITSWNAGAERLFGFTADEVIGKSISLIIPPERLDEENYIMNMLRRGKTVQHYETVRLAKSGLTIAISLTVSPIYDAEGNIVGVSKVSRDITDRRAQERKLKDTHKFLEDMMNHIPDPIFMKDRQHRWIGGNRAFWALMDGPPGKFLGRTDYDFFPKEEADVFWQRDDLVFTSGEALSNEEYFTDSQGRRHVFSTKKMAFLNENGEQFLVGVIRDITDRMAAQEEREKLIAQLTFSNTELERFAYVCSHDLQEPLRMIANYTQRLSQHLDAKLDDKAKHYMRYVMEGANNARLLISDVLNFARIGTETEKTEQTDVTQVLGMVLHTLEDSIRQGGVSVTHDALPVVQAHRTHVLQLLQNLVGNAVKFRSADAPAVHISAERDGEQWRFAIRDNGIGIPTEYQQKIFEIFQRLHKRSEYPGTGIGLAVCKKIVQLYHCDISLESEPGRGCTFYFTLPAVV